MHDLRARYQYIIFSVGPILQTHDSLKLARHVDGVIITIKADSTRREVVNRAVDTLKEARPKVLGAVLTERTQSIPQAVYRRI
jgi:Mrp family chromosome partitioning ATPase